MMSCKLEPFDKRTVFSQYPQYHTRKMPICLFVCLSVRVYVCPLTTL